jgi:NAD(P)-dependent dehydrogenase (short-subunit alcohol dehydrogenase family)
VTGRTERAGSSPLPGTIHETADQVTRAGGRGVAVAVDHGQDEQVRDLFARVSREAGRLDLLVNNVAHLSDELIRPGVFWERSIDLAEILNVGLRSHYVASFHAAPLLIESGRGVLAFTSSFGSVCYMHGPAYGAQKAGIDKLAADMAVDFRDHSVATVSIWMGPLKTERAARSLAERPDQYEAFMAQAETPEFTGHLLAEFVRDPGRMELSGQTLIGAELARRYGLRDADGAEPPS